MPIKSYFFNAVETGNTYDRIYNAEDVTSYLDKIVGNGVFPVPSNQLQVRANSGMSIIVGAGQGWINGHKMINTADLQLTLTQSDVVLNRIDAVIFYVDFGTRDMGITVKNGTATANPVPPPLTRTEQRYEMCLAQIAVNKQVTSITNANITDTRGNSNLCGFVQGLIQQMDSTTMFLQWQAAFDAWFADVQQQIGTIIPVQQYEATSTAGGTTYNIENLIPEYSYITDILNVYINGLRLSADEYTKTVTTLPGGVTVTQVILKQSVPSGTPVTFVVLKNIEENP